MSGYRITEPAKLDLRVIWREIAKDNRTAAHSVLKHLENHFETLAKSPKIVSERKQLEAFICRHSGIISAFE